MKGIRQRHIGAKRLDQREHEIRYKRLLRLEDEHAGKGFELTEQQIRLIEKANPGDPCTYALQFMNLR